MKKIKIIKCLFPSKDRNWTGVPQPELKGYRCITTSMVKIDNKYYEQFEYIPEHIDLCHQSNKRKGSYVYYELKTCVL